MTGQSYGVDGGIWRDNAQSISTTGPNHDKPGAMSGGVRMNDRIDRSLAREVIAALAASPAGVAARYLSTLEPEDFEDWRDREIFNALTVVNYPDHQGPGSVLAQVNRHLLESGRLRDTDDGLRADLADLIGLEGHPEQLPPLVADLIALRFRHAVQLYALSIAEHATTSPMRDVFDALNTGNQELLRLRQRINLPRTQSTVTNLKDRSA